MPDRKYVHIEIISSEYLQKRAAIVDRLQEFQRIQPEQYFYELLYCLMTPQSSAVNAGIAQRKFEKFFFLENNIDPLSILGDKSHYIRFHKTKSVWINEMKKMYSTIYSMLSGSSSAVEKREWLAHHVKGLSLKEATHFLRNIGMNDGLTILDRHILKNLKFHHVIRIEPTTLTKKQYLLIEKKFQRFSHFLNITTDELDLLFWSRETGAILK